MTGAGSAAGARSLAGIGTASLYLCTPARPDLAHFVEACIQGGVDMVQLRDKDLDAKALLAAAALVREVCAAHGVPFVVNDRPDIALAAGADGVHVGQDDVPPTVARRIMGEHALVGLSTHDPVQLETSRSAPIDYISAGPVVATPTKPGRQGTGPGYAALAARTSRAPVFVTGAVTPSSVGPLAELGVTRFVVVRYLTTAADPRIAAAGLRRAIDEAVERRGINASGAPTSR
ncbi:MAG: thiamine phosphate synthase [Acidimicrobiales bacterium]